jgi:hypothetical protein
MRERCAGSAAHNGLPAEAIGHRARLRMSRVGPRWPAPVIGSSQVEKIVAHEFRPRDLVGGHVVVDFLNTVTARTPIPSTGSWVSTPAGWAELSGQFDPRALRELRRLSEAHPRAAWGAFDRTRSLPGSTALGACRRSPGPRGARVGSSISRGAMEGGRCARSGKNSQAAAYASRSTSRAAVSII